MNQHHPRRRFWLQLGAGLLTAALTVLTVVQREWVELFFGIDPDEGSGSLEVLVTLGAAMLTLTFAAFARVEWQRRLQPAVS